VLENALLFQFRQLSVGSNAMLGKTAKIFKKKKKEKCENIIRIIG